MAKPPLSLIPEVEAANGDTFRLDGTKASTRPSGMNFSTVRGDGFGPGGYALNRRILKDYPDLNLLDTHRFIAKNEDVAYEGRHHSNPRGNDPQQQIQVSLVGWMNYLKGRKVSPLGIDRRTSVWGQPSAARRKWLAELNRYFAASVDSAFRDPSSLSAGLIFTIGRLSTNYVATGEAWYDGCGESIGALLYDYKQVSAWGAPDSQWSNAAHISPDDVAKSVFDTGTDHHRVNASGQYVIASTSSRKYAFIENFRLASATEDNANVDGWFNLMVLGTHGLPLRGVWPNQGIEITDLMTYVVNTYYPKVTFAGERNTYPVGQATWHDNPSFGYDILQQLNDLALWELDMWEGPTLHHRPADLTTYDWIIDTSDPGTTVLFQGDSVETFANGISVTYTDLLTGTTRTLYPSEHPELRDETESNPANLHGEDLWTDADVPWPALEADALQYGRAKLAEFNRPKRPGQYRIGGGYIKDEAGHWHQGWKVRDGQTLGIKDHPEDAPRLIHATTWDDDTKTLTVTVDAPPKTLEAIVARQMRAREGANLA